MKEGKKTLKSLFKSKTKKAAEIAMFDEVSDNFDKELEEYDSLINFIYSYHNQVGIPKFK